jgi:hypothetical protein
MLFNDTPTAKCTLLEKLIVTQLVKKFHVFYGNRKFTAVFMRIRYRFLSKAT